MPIQNLLFLFFQWIILYFVLCTLKTGSVSFTKTENQPPIFISNFNKFELSNPSAIHLQFTTLMSGLNSHLKWRLNSITHVRYVDTNTNDHLSPARETKKTRKRQKCSSQTKLLIIYTKIDTQNHTINSVLKWSSQGIIILKSLYTYYIYFNKHEIISSQWFFLSFTQTHTHTHNIVSSFFPSINHFRNSGIMKNAGKRLKIMPENFINFNHYRIV